MALFFFLSPRSSILTPIYADCGESPGGSLTISSACSFAAPCTSTTATGCNYNGVDNGSLSIGSTGALTINAGQTIYLNPGNSLTITSGGYVNIGKSGSTTGALSFGYLWLPGSGSTITSSQPTITSTTAAPTGSYIRRYTASSIYCAAAASCPTACGYAGGTVAGGTASDGTCLTTSCAATASCCAADYGQSCSACNNCGTCNTGTYLCNGTCSVSAPANQTTYTYYQDADGDGYGNPSVSTTTCSSTPPAGYVSNNTDCYDSNAQAHPGQTNYYYQNRGDGSFDYNCSGAVETYPNAYRALGSTGYQNTTSYGVTTCNSGSGTKAEYPVSSSYCGTNSTNCSNGCNGVEECNVSGNSTGIVYTTLNGNGCFSCGPSSDCQGGIDVGGACAMAGAPFLSSSGVSWSGSLTPEPLGCH